MKIVSISQSDCGLFITHILFSRPPNPPEGGFTNNCPRGDMILYGKYYIHYNYFQSIFKAPLRGVWGAGRI